MKKFFPRYGNRRGVSAIIGGVFVFLIVFTIVAGYFIFDYNAQSSVDLAANEQALRDSQARSENFTLLASLTGTNLLIVNMNDTGPLPIQISAVIVGDLSSGKILASCQSSCGYPGNTALAIDPGKNGTVTTGYRCNLCTVWIKVTTTLGTSEIAYYPPNLGPQTSGSPPFAVVANGIGDIYINFTSYTYYQIPQTKCGSTSTYCLNLQSGGYGSAYTIPSSQFTCTSCPALAFSISVKDLNPQQLSITLDGYTQFYQFWGTGSSYRFLNWAIVSMDSAGFGDISQFYSPITLQYNQSTTLVFAANLVCLGGQSCTGFGPSDVSTFNSGGFQVNSNTQTHNGLPNPALVSTFLFFHGCKPSSSTCSATGSNGNYGQNIPFVTTDYT